MADLKALGEYLRAAVRAKNVRATLDSTLDCVVDLMEADPSGKALWRALRLIGAEDGWREARMWMERVRDTHPDPEVRESFGMLRTLFRSVHREDTLDKYHLYGPYGLFNRF